MLNILSIGSIITKNRTNKQRIRLKMQKYSIYV